jgi:phage virion morphogenesis protein
MPLSIEVTKTNFTEVKARIRQQINWLKQVDVPLAKIATEMYSGVQKNFREQSADGKAWKPFSITTLIEKATRKRRRSVNPMLLQDTGHLRQSIYPEVQGSEAIVSTNIPYAKYHQFGSKKIPNHPPKRAFLLIRQASKERILNIARNWVYKGA